jgi:ribosomal protein L11 methyltransferase
MQWTKFTININESAEEDVSYLLSEMGIDSVEIEDLSPVPDDIQSGTFAELQPDRP